MCRQYFTLYSWCQCEEDAGYQACSSRKDNECPGVAVETVHMQCFCHMHATKGFKSERKSRKSRSSRSSRNSQCSDGSGAASLEEKSSQTSTRRRWFRLWTRAD